MFRDEVLGRKGFRSGSGSGSLKIFRIRIPCYEESFFLLTVPTAHRIIDDRIEKRKKGRRIGHCAFAASIFKVQRLR